MVIRTVFIPVSAQHFLLGQQLKRGLADAGCVLARAFIDMEFWLHDIGAVWHLTPTPHTFCYFINFS